MEDEEAISRLLRLGFTKYEARVYYALLKHGALTSTELIKLSGIPQARLYDIIERLTSKGLVRTSKGRPARYSVIEPEVALRNYVEQEMLDKAKLVDELLRRVERGVPRVEENHIWSVSGVRGVKAAVRELVEGAEDELLVATYADFAGEALLRSLERIRGSGASTCIILYDKDDAIVEKLISYDEVRFKPTRGPIMILADLTKGLVIPRTYRERPAAYIIEDVEILSLIVNYFFNLKDTSSPVVYRLGTEIESRRFRSLIRAIEMIQRMWENRVEVEIEAEGRWVSSGEAGTIRGKPISATRDKYREITSLVVERDGARILIGGRGAVYEDFEALRITVYRPR